MFALDIGWILLPGATMNVDDVMFGALLFGFKLVGCSCAATQLLPHEDC